MPSASSRPDDLTEPIWLVAPPDTKGLPAAGPDPLAAAAAAPPAARPRTSRRPTSGPPQLSRGQLLVAAGLVVLAIGIGATAGTMTSGQGGTPTPIPAGPSSAAPSAVAIDATVSSLDPAGGSGFAERDKEWRTQTYRSASFGGLKPGVGLILDLGTPRAVTSVTFAASTPGSTVSLQVADKAPTTDDGLRPVGAEVTASGRTVLDGRSGGKHRYWVVWVSKLGPRSDGFGATFGTPQVSGPPAG